MVTLSAAVSLVLTGCSLLGRDALLTVLQTLDAANMLDDLDFVNLTELTDVRIGYDKRFDIRAGSLDDLTYRLRFAQTVISDRLSASDIGRLYWDAQNRLHFVPETAEDVHAPVPIRQVTIR